MHAPGAAQAGALAGHVLRGGQACANEPLRQGGVQAAGDWVFDQAVVAGEEGAHFEGNAIKVGVVGSTDAEGIAFEVRAFFPGNNGLAEDPVTGSLNAALAQWLIGAGLAPAQYVAAQGTCLGRAGRVYVQQDGETIWVGGSSVTCMAGEVLL